MRIILYVIFAIIATLFGRDQRYNYTYNDSNSVPFEALRLKKQQRKNALNVAKPFLKPHKKDFGDLCLSNKYCIININSKKRVVSAISKIPDSNGDRKCFVAKNFEVLNIDDYWNTVCLSFNNDTKFQNLLDSTVKVAAIHCEAIKSSNSNSNLTLNNDKSAKEKNLKIGIIDLNNCSEMELTGLPGVSIIMAKKIVKRRNNTPYKNIDEFFTEFNIKEHFKAQLRSLICANSPKAIFNRKLNKDARIVDF